jgi:hypothetical protein
VKYTAAPSSAVCWSKSVMFAPCRKRKLEMAAMMPGRSGHCTRRMARGSVMREAARY